MVNAVLATDMANHGKLVGAFKDKIAEKAGNSNEKDEKDLLLKMFIKTADLSNTVKPFDIARMWAVNVTEVVSSLPLLQAVDWLSTYGWPGLVPPVAQGGISGMSLQ